MRLCSDVSLAGFAATRHCSCLLPCPTLLLTLQLASSTNTRHLQNVYTGQFHVPAQPLASQTSLSVVRIHHFGRGRVSSPTKSLRRVTRFTAQRVMSFLPTFCGEPPRFPSGELGTTNWVYFNRRTVKRTPPLAVV